MGYGPCNTDHDLNDDDYGNWAAGQYCLLMKETLPRFFTLIFILKIINLFYFIY